MEQGVLTLTGTPSATFHSDCPRLSFTIIKEAMLIVARRF